MKNPSAVALGSIKSKKKAKASKENGKRGGRPKLYKIPLTQGKYALVDDIDFEYFSQFKWCMMKNRRNFYAMRTFPRQGGGWTSQYLHRVILGRKLGRPLVKGDQVDHKNHDSLCNIRENLRLATGAQNSMNRRQKLNSSSKYLGVSLRYESNRLKKWKAMIKANGKPKFLGYFSEEKDAAISYDKAARIYHGEFANPNFNLK